MNEKKVVNCPQCRSALGVEAGAEVYECPVCNRLFQIHTGARMVKEVSNAPKMELYVSVDRNSKAHTVTKTNR